MVKLPVMVMNLLASESSSSLQVKKRGQVTQKNQNLNPIVGGWRISSIHRLEKGCKRVYALLHTVEFIIWRTLHES